jgi:hypothetical protein
MTFSGAFPLIKSSAAATDAAVAAVPVEKPVLRFFLSFFSTKTPLEVDGV